VHSAGVQEVSGGRGGKCVGGRTIDVGSGASLTCNRGPLRVIKDVGMLRRGIQWLCSPLMAKCLKTAMSKLMKVRIAQAVFCRSLQMSMLLALHRPPGCNTADRIGYRVRSNFRIADDIGIGVGAILRFQRQALSMAL